LAKLPSCATFDKEWPVIRWMSDQTSHIAGGAGRCGLKGKMMIERTFGESYAGSAPEN